MRLLIKTRLLFDVSLASKVPSLALNRLSSLLLLPKRVLPHIVHHTWRHVLVWHLLRTHVLEHVRRSSHKIHGIRRVHVELVAHHLHLVEAMLHHKVVVTAKLLLLAKVHLISQAVLLEVDLDRLLLLLLGLVHHVVSRILVVGHYVLSPVERVTFTVIRVRRRELNLRLRKHVLRCLVKTGLERSRLLVQGSHIILNLVRFAQLLVFAGVLQDLRILLVPWLLLLIKTLDWNNLWLRLL